MGLTVNSVGTTRTVSVTGELDLSSVAIFTTAIEECRGDKVGVVIVDLSALEFIDSTGMAAMVMANKLLSESDCALRIVPSNSNAVNRLFELVGLKAALPFLTDRPSPTTSGVD
jgi:anti-sigma B factor antagonist